jgi:hypothetical protein
MVNRHICIFNVAAPVERWQETVFEGKARETISGCARRIINSWILK